MLEIAVELAAHQPAYDDLTLNFAAQFVLIGRAMNGIGPAGMWDEEDGFYYDVLRLPDGSATRLKVRSMVGLLPLCATTVVERCQRERVPKLTARTYERFRRMPELAASIHATGPGHFGVAERGILALVNEGRLRRILSRMLDENEFLSPYGIRARSRYHADWRGPIWMPVNLYHLNAEEEPELPDYPNPRDFPHDRGHDLQDPPRRP
jgi:hypothetical protein